MRLIRGDSGSIPLALLATIVTGGLIVVLVGSTMTAQSTVRFDRSFTNVIQGAEAGLQDAYHQISQGVVSVDIGEESPVYTTEINGATARWQVRRLSSRSYEVASTGLLDGVERTVVARVEKEALFFPGAFGDRLVALNGTSTHVDSYESWSETCPATRQPDKCWGDDDLHGTGKGALGTNEDFDFSGNAVVERALLYDWLANPGIDPTPQNPGGSRCSGNPCTAEILRLVDKRLDYGSDEAMQFVFDKLANCTGRELGTAVYGGKVGKDTYPTSLPPQSTDPADNPADASPADDNWNNYYCADSLEFVGSTDFPGASPETPVVIFVRDYVKVSKPQSLINCPGCPNSGGTNYWRTVRPKAASLQIYSASNADAGGGNTFIKSGSVFAGVLYAPRARCGADTGSAGGAGVDIYGSIICRIVDNVGNWKFHFDETLSDIGRDRYTVSQWREDPEEAVTAP